MARDSRLSRVLVAAAVVEMAISVVEGLVSAVAAEAGASVANYDLHRNSCESATVGRKPEAAEQMESTSTSCRSLSWKS